MKVTCKIIAFSQLPFNKLRIIINSLTYLHIFSSKIIPQLIQDEIAATVKSNHKTLHIQPLEVMTSLQGFKWENVMNELIAATPLLTAVISSNTILYLNTPKIFNVCMSNTLERTFTEISL